MKFFWQYSDTFYCKAIDFCHSEIYNRRKAMMKGDNNESMR